MWKRKKQSTQEVNVVDKQPALDDERPGRLATQLLDKKILKLLAKKNLSILEIVAATGKTRRQVNYRLQHMQHDGLIIRHSLGRYTVYELVKDAN